MSRLLPAVRHRIAAEIAVAGGREVSFAGDLDAEGRVVAVQVVARGTIDAVLALPGAAERGQMLLHNHPSGVLEPSQADLSVAARLHDAGVGFGIVSNDATDLYVVVEIPRPRSRVSLDAVEVAALLGRDGPVATILGQYEDRPSQRDMAAFVTDLYNEGGIALLEAGTGVGKSFAYLVPAIRWALENGERTVVSTNTINLQEQLAGKDMPMLARAFASLGATPTFALLKGWRNYLCLARLDLAMGGQISLVEDSLAGELDRIGAWARKTADGSLADLADPPPPEVWDEVSAEPDLCPRLKCPHFERCFLFEARSDTGETRTRCGQFVKQHPHAANGPEQIDAGGPGSRHHIANPSELFPQGLQGACRGEPNPQCDPHGCRYANGGRASDHHGPDGLRNFRIGPAEAVLLPLREQELVNQDYPLGCPLDRFHCVTGWVQRTFQSRGLRTYARSLGPALSA